MGMPQVYHGFYVLSIVATRDVPTFNLIMGLARPLISADYCNIKWIEEKPQHVVAGCVCVRACVCVYH